MEIIYIAPTASQPRYHKRVSQISKFANISVFYFNRGYYEENFFPNDIHSESLGTLEDGKYLKRFFRLLPVTRKIRNFINSNKTTVFYVNSLDGLILAKLAGIKTGFFEMGDLRQEKGLGLLFSFFESFLLKNIIAIILTSKYFYFGYYAKKKIPEKKIFIIDNKVNPVLTKYRPNANIQRKRLVKKVTIGLIGLLRYEKPIKLLLDFAKNNPGRYSVECFGDGPLKKLVENYVSKNIRYHGSFKNPDDLIRIYNSIDVNYVVYDSISKNVRLAIPNKLFESAFFGVPIVCCHGTAVGKMALEWGIGKMVRIDKVSYFENDFNEISKEWIEQCRKNCLKIKTEDLIDNGDQIIKKMIRNYYN